MKTFKIIFYIGVAINLFFLSGCGYHLGNTLPKGMETIHIPIFKNHTQEPNIELGFTDKTIERFLIDGSLQVTEEEDADVTLTVEIIDYRKEPVRFTGSDFNVVKEYRIYATAKVSLIWKDGTPVFKDRTITADSDFVIGEDVAEAERIARGTSGETDSLALPNLEEDMSQKIAETVLEDW